MVTKVNTAVETIPTNPSVSFQSEDKDLNPERAHPTDAGVDLKSTEDSFVIAGTRKLVDTGVAVKIPVGYVGLVFSRSSQGSLGVSLANSVGVIDSDYRGNIKVLIENRGREPYQIVAKKTKIAQLVVVPCMLADFIMYEGDDWNDTVRGVGGFGSTDKG